MCCLLFVFYKQKTAYEMRISDWSSDVCSSDLPPRRLRVVDEVEARAFVKEALAKLGLGLGAEARGVPDARRPFERDEPVGERAGRHILRRHVDRRHELGIRRLVARERGERGDADEEIGRANV